MRKFLLLAPLFVASAALAQQTKQATSPTHKNHSPVDFNITRPGKVNVPPSDSPFGLPSVKRQPLPALQRLAAPAPDAVRTVMGENGLPIFFQGKTTASPAPDTALVAALAPLYFASLRPTGIAYAAQEFLPTEVTRDEQGGIHVRMMQVFQGIEVYGAEVIAHCKKGQFETLNGRYYPTPSLESVTPAVHAANAIHAVMEHIGKAKDFWTPEELKMIGYQPYATRLVIYHPDRNLRGERLAWHVTAHPDVMRRLEYFIDANTGEVIYFFDNTCFIDGGRLSAHHTPTQGTLQNPNPEAPTPNSDLGAPPPPDGAVTGTGQDLFNTARSFGAWQEGSTVYLEDASKSMFKASSKMPGDPQGAIVTLDAKNTSPANSPSFGYDFVKSASTSFNNKVAVSAHWNSIKSFDYYKATFNRNSIDGNGGSIIAFVNVAEETGGAMDNAFWNGDAMWYGNGDQAFKQLARGLDVGGHEMTHGVVEKTANLEYQGESGALNESFADVFGAMIDRDDWKIGEDVMQPGISNSGVLRDLSDPHNGDVKGGNFWQPKHVNEIFTGSQDNGGVHINSGIPNYAFYLFASNAAVGKDKAEQVYYKALRDYLVKSSKFVDCRLAVIQAAKDLYGAAVSDVAANAFAAVGIGSSQPSGNYQGQLALNPGKDLILVTSNNQSTLSLALGNGTILGNLYTQGLRSRPSVSDGGTEIVFVNAAGQIMLITLDYLPNGTITPTVEVLESQKIWHNAAISKDARFLAFTTEDRDNLIYFVDAATQNQEVFDLYNPTYTQGQTTGDVLYSDVLEFDYSGEYLMYDAFNELPNGQALSYWDIGFLQFWENGQFAVPKDAFISKLFSGIPDNTGIGDPAFAKNSPYIIAFDFFDESDPNNTRYDLYGANVETGDYDVLVSNNGDLGWPNFTRTDNAILYQRPSGATAYNLRLQGLAASKIAPQGSSSALINNGQWGVWFANGTRSLEVSADEPKTNPFNLSISPNPANGMTRLTLTASDAEPAYLIVTNLLGEVLQNRSVEMSIGQNQFDLDLSALPVGMYVVRLHTSRAQGAIVVVKK